MKTKKTDPALRGTLTPLKVRKHKFQIDYQYIDPVRAGGGIICCDIMAYSKKQALFLFERRHRFGVYKILEVTDWGVQAYDKDKKEKV
jgi:hypothetical protein